MTKGHSQKEALSNLKSKKHSIIQIDRKWETEISGTKSIKAQYKHPKCFKLFITSGERYLFL